MKIDKLVRIEKDGSIGFDVHITHKGKEFIESFDGYDYWMRDDASGNPIFIARIRENMERREKPTKDVPTMATEVKKFRGREIP